MKALVRTAVLWLPMTGPVAVGGPSVLAAPGEGSGLEKIAATEPGVDRTEIQIPEGSSLDEAVGMITGAGLDADTMEEALAGLFEDTEENGDALAHAELTAAMRMADAGLLGAAADYFREADSAAVSDEFRVAARSNLGHVLYRGAMETMASGGGEQGGAPDFDGAIASMRKSAEAFRSVLEIDRSNGEASRNVERVRRAIDRIEQMRQQAQEQAEQMRQQADKLDDLADRQQQESMENDQQAQPGDEAQQDQSSLNEETEQQSQQMREQPGGEGAKEQVEQAQQSQQEAQEALEKGDQQAASDAQREAAEQLREAAKQLREEADQTDGQQGQPQEGQSGEQPEEGSEEGAEQDGEPQPGEEQEGESKEDRIAQWLLDREQRQREQRDQQQRAMRGRGVPVEKDW